MRDGWYELNVSVELDYNTGEIIGQSGLDDFSDDEMAELLDVAERNSDGSWVEIIGSAQIENGSIVGTSGFGEDLPHDYVLDVISRADTTFTPSSGSSMREMMDMMDS